MILHGSGDEKIPFTYLSDRGKPLVREHAFEGIIPNLERRYRETDSVMVREELAKYLNNKPCPECNGTRLKREARLVKVGDGDTARPIYEISGLPLKATMEFFRALKLDGQKAAIADRIIKEIVSRLQFLNNVGLDYLALDRSAETLSGGEAQRYRLASQIGSGLTGVMYVLDEPSIGLHQRDNDRLLATLKHLRDLGNSVIVVEHDEDAISAADYVVDMGPGAGEHGGQVVAQGTPDDIRRAPHSLTGQYLAGHRQIPIPARRNKADLTRVLTITGARGNNLQEVALKLPVGLFVCVTGVSGSGKSTLINDTLYHAVARHLYDSAEEPAAYGEIDGLEHFDKVISVDQSPIGRTPRSNPATYTGLFTPIRELFAQVKEGRERRLRAGPLLVQRQGRPLRGLPGRRPHQGRDALPARRLRAVRRVPRPALQPRDAGDPVQGAQHPRSAGDDRRAGARVLRAGAGGRAQAVHAARRGPGVRHAGADRRRRSPAARRSA